MATSQPDGQDPLLRLRLRECNWVTMNVGRRIYQVILPHSAVFSRSSSRFHGVVYCI